MNCRSWLIAWFSPRRVESKVLSIILALMLAACGGGNDSQVEISKTIDPRPTANAVTVFGGSGVAIHLYQALYGMAPSNALLIDYTAQANTNQSTFIRALTANFDNMSASALSSLVLDNLGVTASTVTNTAPAGGLSSYALLLEAVNQIFDVYPKEARGQIILNLCNLLAGLEGDATYGNTATSFNNQSRLNFAYSTATTSTLPAAIPNIPLVASLTLSGSAASGLAIAGATISAKCQTGSGTATTLSDGSYQLVITGGVLPCVLEVTNPADSSKLHSVAVGSVAAVTANITPLTEMLTARVLGSEPVTFFAAFDPAVATSSITTARVQAAHTDVALVLSGTLDTSSIGNFVSTVLKPATTSNTASGDTQDKLLDTLKVKLNSTQLTQVVTALAQTVSTSAIKQMVQDRVAANQTQLTSTVNLSTNTVVLQWSDSFPTGVSYRIETQNADGSYSAVETLPGAGGSGSAIQWQRALTVSGIYRVVAVLPSSSVTISTPQGQSSVSVNVPPKAQAITFPSPGNQTIGTAAPALVATSTSGLAVSLTSSTSTVCTVSGTTLTLVAAGSCTVTATQAGSTGFAAATPVSVTFTVAAAAPVPPTIILDKTEPLSGAVKLSLSSASAYTNVTWYTDLRLIGTGTGVGNPVTWNTSAETNGSHLILARVQVATDSYIEVRRTVSVSNSNIAVSASASGTTGTINVDVTASSLFGIAVVDAVFDGVSIGSLTTPNACSSRMGCSSSNNVYRFSINAATARSGSHTMLVTAIDTAGNSKSTTVQVPISNLPGLTVSSPADGTLVNGMLYLSGSYTTDKTGLVTVLATLGSYQFMSSTNQSFSGSMNLVGLTPGSYTLTVSATDSTKAVTTIQRTLTVTSSAPLAYAPLFNMGAAGQILAANDEQLLYSSDSGVRLRNVRAGTEVLLGGGADATRYMQDWQISNGYVYANGKGVDCFWACVYQWDPQGTLQNLSNSNVYSASPSDMGGRAYDRHSVAHDGYVIWVNDQANQAQLLGGTGWYTLYDIAKGTYSKISPPDGSRLVGNNGYDFVVEANGALSFYYWARFGFVDVSATFDVFRWSSVNNASSKISTTAPNNIQPKSDGRRWIWQQTATGGTGAITLLSQAVSGGEVTTLSSSAGNYQLRDGVVAWLETTTTSTGGIGGTVPTVTGLKVIVGNQPMATISSRAGVNLYGVGGAQVVFGEAGKVYSWNTTTKTSTLLIDTAPSQVFQSGSTLYFVMGNSQTVYRITLN